MQQTLCLCHNAAKDCLCLCLCQLSGGLRVEVLHAMIASLAHVTDITHCGSSSLPCLRVCLKGLLQLGGQATLDSGSAAH